MTNHLRIIVPPAESSTVWVVPPQTNPVFFLPIIPCHHVHKWPQRWMLWSPKPPNAGVSRGSHLTAWRKVLRPHLMRPRNLACKGMSLGNVESQYFVGSASPFGH